MILSNCTLVKKVHKSTSAFFESLKIHALLCSAELSRTREGSPSLPIARAILDVKGLSKSKSIKPNKRKYKIEQKVIIMKGAVPKKGTKFDVRCVIALRNFA
eukprot:874799-Pelagomonas_calceolata.AAC.3